MSAVTQEQADLALDVIQAVITVIEPSAGVAADTAITVIRAIVRQWQKAGKEITADEVRRELEHWLSALRENDEAADAALKKKFPEG